ncbi:hypothetical protein [Rhodococcus phenolicus]|uniref:hypothetical protein n=1 Tax=Rhodococcus phenolicus TaxID=263849 RepID=UPI0008366942|nr:hypothetical protein [Rhodococcus phenolicus]
MRSRVVIIVIAAVGLILVAAGSTFAYLGTPDTTVTVAESPDPDAGSGDGLGTARDRLQRAGLPLSMLDGGVGQLTDGSRQLDDGARQLSDGLQQAREGGEQLAAGLDQLDGGVVQLGDGATQISGGVDEVVGRLTGLGAMQGTVTEQLTSVADTLGMSPDPVSRGAAGQLRTLVDTLNTQGLGPDTLDQLSELRDGARQLAYELTDPNAQFVAGMAQAAGGSAQLRDGLVLLDDGGRALTDGTGQLVDGVGPVAGVVAGIADNVRSATDALPRITDTGTEQPVATVAKAPVRWWPYAVIGLGAVALAATVAGALAPVARRADG